MFRFFFSGMKIVKFRKNYCRRPPTPLYYDQLKTVSPSCEPAGMPGSKKSILYPCKTVF